MGRRIPYSSVGGEKRNAVPLSSWGSAMPDVSKLEQYMTLVDKLVLVADKNELAECAKLLAMNVAHYEMKYGELPRKECLAVVTSNELTDEQSKLVTKGMETMVG